MAKDSEKRFNSVMDKLFYAPKPSPTSTSSVEASRGKKRAHPSSALALVEPKWRGVREQGFRHCSAPASPSQPPVCRPWDRGDLMRRVATFKSMTWFAKPKVVSALNCARRGWVNIDVDTIACESCRARVLFSTPSSWNQQQVEKAALVFSLKLDNGHKMLCPWIDNACDEMLAEFPPTPPPVLVDKFRERCSAILQLPVLPVISSSAIEYMKSPQLDQFLGQSSIFFGNGSTEISRIEHSDDEGSAESAKLYYQAQKLISLCGWEPRSLPYIVDSEKRLNQSTPKANVLSSSHLTANSQYPIISVQYASNHDLIEANETFSSSSALQSESNSVVLDCKLCGASVGLWAFTTVPRPVELFQLVGYAEENSETHLGTHDSSTESHLGNRTDVVSAGSDGATASKNRFSNLNLTIAGGPTPTKQNFKAKISLPVIGQNLRAQFSYNSEFRECLSFSQEDMQSGSQKENLLQGGECYLENAENVGLENSEVSDPGHSTARDANNTYKGGEDNNNLLVMASSNGDLLDSGTVVEHRQSQESPCAPSSLEASAVTHCTSNHEVRQEKLQIPVNNELVACNTGKDLRHASPGGTMEFDSIKQHRHFCPWIASTGNGAPGWKQTLSALQRQDGCSPSSASIIKVDDPITSIRNLFMSPSPKRMKPTVLTTRSPQQ
ncbi:putative Zinc finger, C3HC [Rosa chinensis]|uniref:Putative Zinc finger, C3HC n=1 Tax=Rosa chinensis TaxID=74649 RepID=A0A2P6P3G8_ROSCH|nr:uncharacterized protein LOC112176616 [Rosa chinensis]PRQ16451.1 putative Zinc finger, C3HC [Rosa chinensis]